MFKQSLLAIIILCISNVMAFSATLEIGIDLSSQKMRVIQYGKLSYNWPVSTARRGYKTPTGTFKPIRLERMWYSRKYDYSPMPHSIFFYGGYAIHGTTELKSLGRPASHGCIRLHPDHAKILFNLVRRHGYSASKIRITR